jgi:hypothetical protein
LRASQESVRNLQRVIRELGTRYDAECAVNATLRTNLATVFATAHAEIARKDRQIAELQRDAGLPFDEAALRGDRLRGSFPTEGTANADPFASRGVER